MRKGSGTDMDKQYKYYVIYPLYIIPRSIKIVPDDFFKCIDLTRIKDNILKTFWRNEEIPYSMVGDNIDSELVFGRMIRLNKDDIDRIDIEKLKEEIITNGQSQYVAENSHFVLDTNTNLVFAEYNPSAVNALSSRASDVFAYVLRKCSSQMPKIKMLPAPSDEFIKDIVDHAVITKYHFDFPSVNLKNLESIGASSPLINKIAEKGNFGFDMGVKLKLPEELSGPWLVSLREIAQKAKQIGGKSYKIVTNEGSFDLIKENLIFYDVEIERGRRSDMKERLYQELRTLIKEKSDVMLKFVEKQPDLEGKWS